MDLLLEHLGKGLFYIIIISMPIVLTAAGIGLIVGILQAVTQVQEQTIAAAPKILGVFLVVLIGGTVIMQVLSNYLIDAINLATSVVPHNGYFAAAPLGHEDPDKKVREFFNGHKFVRKKDAPKFKDMLDRPADSPYLKQKEPKKTDVYTPAPPIADANISEEIENYKDNMDKDFETRNTPGIDQKAPVIPPVSKPKTNPTISILPELDEPPVISAEDIESLPTIASNLDSSESSVTGAAAYITPDGVHKFDSRKNNSTIIISSGKEDSGSEKIFKNLKKKTKRGAIILESQ